MLFNDTILSKNNTISCASCHFLNDGGDDNIQHPYGIDGISISRNSPTVFNAVFNATQHWDGAFNTLQEQVDSSIKNDFSMHSNFIDIINKLNKNKLYKEKFHSIYKEEINKKNILDTISEFIKALITPNSKFDKYLNGNTSILSNDELDGYKLFKEYGCISCHNGVNIGGNLITKIGFIKTYDTSDLGHYYVSNKKEDIYYFKVPSLRNIELTAPYFHDGKIKTLKGAVKKMIFHQVGYTLNDKEIDNIIKFLKTLTGETPEILNELNNE